MSKNRVDPQLQHVLSVSQTAKRTRSPLYYWMRQHYAALEAEFAANGPLWEARTSAFADAGLKDYDGKAATIRRVQETWYHVKRDLAAAATERKTAPVPATATPPAPVSARPVLAKPPPRIEPEHDDVEDRPRPRFAPSRPKNWTVQGSTE